MVIDSSSDRFLSNSNKTLRVINGGQLNGFAEKSLPINGQPINGQPIVTPVNTPANTPLKTPLNTPVNALVNSQPFNQRPNQTSNPLNSIQQAIQPNHQPNHQQQHNHTNNCLNQHNHHNHIRGECNRVPARLPNEPESKMNSPTAYADKANLLQNNSLLKDSNQSVNLPILGKPLDDSEDENDDILEISPCGRWSKRREQVCLSLSLSVSPLLSHRAAQSLTNKSDRLTCSLTYLI